MSGHVVPKKTYFIVFAILIALLVLTVAVAYLLVPAPWNILIAMTIAVAKAILVILYFMHVKYSSRMTMIFVCAGFFWFLIMVGFTLSDYLSRDLVPILGK